MSSSRILTRRRADTRSRLLEAASEELRQAGWEDLTVRRVAGRAGVSSATAYTYFDSKEHLVTEVFWEKVQNLREQSLREQSLPEQSLPEPTTGTVGGPRVPDPGDRVAAAMEDFGALVADEPNLAAACTVAMMSNEPAVAALRSRIGAAVADRIAAALGADPTSKVVRALSLTFSGAMVQAGMGHLRYVDIPGAMAEVARLMVASSDQRAPSNQEDRR